MLAKLEVFWKRYRSDTDETSLAPLGSLNRAAAETGAGRGTIINAQTILDIYIEAWSTYSGDDGLRTLPEQLPCWVISRKYVPPKDGWSSFVFRNLLNRSDVPIWNDVEFRKLYGRFKSIWFPSQDYVGSFDDRFCRIIGKFILVTFNSDRTKEVGTSHGSGSWHVGHPPFFQIQYYAPYFSPLESNFEFPWLWVPDHDRLLPDMPLDTTSTSMTLKDFQANYDLLEKVWLEVWNDTITSNERNSDYLDALDRLMTHAGPRWVHGDALPYVLPWECLLIQGDEIHTDDCFRVPTRAVALKQKPCRPTIFLPTRHNVMSFVERVESLSDDPEISLKTKHIRSVLDNNGQQYSIPSHLEMKSMASESVALPASTLRLNIIIRSNYI
ncbi:hypothetical protein NLG97_g225 [Lecanicillium saksenae]|uniref:Uncharacterized protein n=1 Tax=Lecanicillium saksenae TaxID=468837 RepID=A0ACC1RAP2_9HYPO|nr:hypothetical protein NLG97_g225 [Lecanicillium saksenae]